MCMVIAGKRPRRRPEMRWMDKAKGDLNELDIDIGEALDRNKLKQNNLESKPHMNEINARKEKTD